MVCHVDCTEQYAAYKILDAIATHLVPFAGQLCGYNIKQNMAILTADLFRETPSVSITHIYPWIFHETFSPPPYFNPYEMIVPSTMRNDVGYNEFHRFMGCEHITVRTVTAQGAVGIGSTHEMVTPWHQISYLWEVLQRMQIL